MVSHWAETVATKAERATTARKRMTLRLRDRLSKPEYAFIDGGFVQMIPNAMYGEVRVSVLQV
jgi:hypothetical protein